MKISIALMCHESRAELWDPLHAQFEDATLCVDDGRLGRWGNGRRCLKAYDPGADYHLVLQDDALPAPDLLAALEMWLPHLGNSILCLYSGRVRGWRAVHDKYAKPPCWLSMSKIQWGVALVVPTHVAADLVRIGDRLTKMDNYDSRLGEANRKSHKLPVLVPSPSWVQHAVTPSTVPGRKPNRQALHHYGSESLLQWGNPGDVPIIRVPDFDRPIIRRQAAQYRGSGL